LSKHPLESYDALLAEQTVPLAEITKEADGKSATVGGIIGTIRQITTKNGQAMAFVKLEDVVGDERELVVFPSVFKDSAETWQTQKVIIAKGRISTSDRNGLQLDEPKILVESVQLVSLADAQNYSPKGKKPKIMDSPVRAKKNPATAPPKATPPAKRLYLRLSDASDNAMLQKLKTILDGSLGGSEAVLVLGTDKQVIKLPQLVLASDELVGQLKTLLGNDKVKFQ
jgi:DNA polymerase-3 subunit alpha